MGEYLGGVTFYVLDQFPVPSLTIAAVVVAAFLFIATSVVSAAFVLGKFSTGGDLNPSPLLVVCLLKALKAKRLGSS